MIGARVSRSSPAPGGRSSEDGENRPLVHLSAEAGSGRAKPMVLSFLLHGLLAIGLFAFDGLNSKSWRQLGADAAGPSFIEVEMLASQMDVKKSVQIQAKQQQVLFKQNAELNTDVPTQREVSRDVKNETEPNETVASATSSTAAGASSSAIATVANSSAANLADAEMVYLNDLRQLLESKKEYPIAARRMGHRGRVVVRFVLERDGRVRTAEIVQGSQSEILNRAARGLIGRLHDVKPFPKEVALTEWAVVVPIEYQM